MDARRLALIVAMIIALGISLTLQTIFTVSQVAGEIALLVDSMVTTYLIVEAVRLLRQRIR
jgi:hypothetical protein